MQLLVMLRPPLSSQIVDQCTHMHSRLPHLWCSRTWLRRVPRLPYSSVVAWYTCQTRSSRPAQRSTIACSVCKRVLHTATDSWLASPTHWSQPSPKVIFRSGISTSVVHAGIDQNQDTNLTTMNQLQWKVSQLHGILVQQFSSDLIGLPVCLPRGLVEDIVMTTNVHHTVLEMKLPAVLDTEYLWAVWVMCVWGGEGGYKWYVR